MLKLWGRAYKGPFAGFITFVLVVSVFSFLAIIIPLSLPWHFLLRLFGHSGFTKWEGSKLSYEVPWWGCLLAIAPIMLVIV